MAFWYNINDKKYAENERKSWLRAYCEKLVSNLRTEQNTKFSSHTTGDAYRHSAEDVDCSNNKNVQEVLNSYSEQLDTISQTVSGKVDKMTGKGLSSNDYTDSEKAEVAKIKDKVDKVEGKGLSTNDLTDDYKSKLDALNSNLAGKATNTSVLRTTVPNQPFTPTSDYHPATKKYVDDSVATKVDKVEGKGLSTNDLTDDYKSKLDALNSNLAGKATNTSVLRTTVPNQPFTPTSDYHPATKKYVDDSVATKVDKVEGKGLSTNDLTDDYKSKLDALNSNLAGKATNTSVLRTTVPNQPFTPKTDYHPATKKYVDDSVANKVDKVEGKGLSTNDLTDDYKSKLDALNSNLAGKATNTSVLRTTVPNQPFTPKTDYHPATKKYVDDSVAALKTELLALINKS